MEILCQHCNSDINANFCSNCGQKRYKRIDKKYVYDEIQYVLIHTNKGFLYSVKNIIKNPGKTARDFIIGDRVNHYKPLLLAFMLSGISTFISYKVLKMGEIMNVYFASQYASSLFMNDVSTFLSSYTSIITLLLIPIFALFTKIAFGGWGQNYYEHIIMNSYVLSFYNIVCILIIYPISYFFKANATGFIVVVSSGVLLIPLILIWFFKEFYPEKALKIIIYKVLLTLLLVFVGYLLFIMAVVAGGFIYAFIKGPEALKYMMPQKV